MGASFSGRIILALNGLPVLYLKSLSVDTETNRELVVGMNPLGTPLGFVEGTREYSLSADCYVPKVDPMVALGGWESISGAIVALVPPDGGSPSILYTGVFVKKVGLEFQEKGAAMRKIEMGALFKVEG